MNDGQAWRRQSRARRAPWIALASALVFSTSPALAGTAPMGWPFDWKPNWIPGDPVEPIGATPSLHPPGLIVALDPESHLPTIPSPTQRRAAGILFEGVGALFGALEPLPVERAPGGGELVHLQGRFQVFSVARRDPSGRIIVDCASGVEAAGQLLAQPVSAGRRLEEK